MSGLFSTEPAPGAIHLSIVSPVYQAEDCLREFGQRVRDVVNELTESYEIILVDDGSFDSSWDRIEELSREHEQVRGVRLSRNFGQHLAIAAGLAASRGMYVVVMDCDLQDPPEMIRTLVARAGEGYDVIRTVRRSRSASLFRKAASRAFYGLARVLSSPYARANANTLSLISRKVVKAYLRTFDRYSPYPFILNWLGFRSTAVEIDHQRRAAGSSSYTLTKLLRAALNGLVSQSTRLLHISTAIGLLFSLFSVVQVLWIVYLRLSRTTVVPGWASLMAVLWFVGGVILFSLGVIGLYLTRVFEQTRNQPFFIVSEATSDGEPFLGETTDESSADRRSAYCGRH